MHLEFRFLADEQDPLASFLAEAVSHLAVAALATVDAIGVMRELPTPALQRRQPNAEQQRQLMGSGTFGHALVEDLQGLPVVDRRRQIVTALSAEGLNLF
jgi:hypothetical protein